MSKLRELINLEKAESRFDNEYVDEIKALLFDASEEIADLMDAVRGLFPGSEIEEKLLALDKKLNGEG